MDDSGEFMRQESDVLEEAARRQKEQFGSSGEKLDLDDLESGTAHETRVKRAFYYD